MRYRRPKAPPRRCLFCGDASVGYYHCGREDCARAFHSHMLRLLPGQASVGDSVALVSAHSWEGGYAPTGAEGRLTARDGDGYTMALQDGRTITVGRYKVRRI